MKLLIESIGSHRQLVIGVCRVLEFALSGCAQTCLSHESGDALTASFDVLSRQFLRDSRRAVSTSSLGKYLTDFALELLVSLLVFALRSLLPFVERARRN